MSYIVISEYAEKLNDSELIETAQEYWDMFEGEGDGPIRPDTVEKAIGYLMMNGYRVLEESE